VLLEILGLTLNLILDDSDVNRDRSWCSFGFGCLSQLLELTFLPAPPEGTTPRHRYVALPHELSLGVGEVATVALAAGARRPDRRKGTVRLRSDDLANLRQWPVRRRGMVQVVAAANRQDIAIVGITIVEELADRSEVEWQLNATPELEWAEIFQLAGPSERRGSIQWVQGSGPDVIGQAVRWFVPNGEIDEADAEVRHRLSVANERFGLGRV